MKKIVVRAVLIIGMLFGFGCLNYTKAFGIESHYEFADESGFPAPSGTIYWMGLLILAASSGVLGFVLGNGQGRSSKMGTNG